MNTDTKRNDKIKKTLHLSDDAVDILRFAGYCSERTAGEFISKLIVEYHERRTHKLPEGLTAADIAWQLKRLTDLLVKLTDG